MNMQHAEIAGEPVTLCRPMSRIMREVSIYFEVPIFELFGRSHAARYARPRQIAMFLMSRMLDKSSVEIGQYFNRDHSTVLHALTRIEGFVKADVRIAEAVLYLALALQVLPLPEQEAV